MYTPTRNKMDFAIMFDTATNCHVVAKAVNNKIHVYRGTKREVIVRCPGKLCAFELQRTAGECWQMWVATQEGCVFRKNIPLPRCHDADSMDVDDHDGGNCSIFDELLDTDSKQTFPDLVDAPIINDQAGDNVCQVGEKDKVFTCSGAVIGICCCDKFCAVTCLEGDCVSVQVHPLRELSSGHTGSLIGVRSSAEAEEGEHHTGIIKQKIIVPELTPSNLEQGCSTDTLKLYVAMPNGVESTSSSQLFLPSHLFSAVFGWESSVRSLPSLLLCLPQGAVYFHHFHVSASSVVPSWRLLCTVDSSVACIVSTKVTRTLTEKESVAAELQKSLGMSAATTAAAAAPSHSTVAAVVVVGASGKCCLMTTVPALASTTADHHRVVVTFSLPIGVHCVCGRDQTLFVSCGRAVHKCCLTLSKTEEGGRKRFGVDVNREELFGASVSSMWLSEAADMLVCETASGALAEYETTAANDSDNTNLNSPRQRSLKELLVGIDVSQCRLQEVKSTQREMNSFLQQVNVATLLLHRQRSAPGAATKEAATAVSARVGVLADAGYLSLQYQVVVTVTNNTTVALTRDWTLFTTLCKADDAQSTELQTSLPSSSSSSSTPSSLVSALSPRSHTLQLLRGLGPGQSAQLKIPVSYSPDCPQLVARVSLVLQAPDRLRRKGCDNGLQGGVAVFLATRVLDFFPASKSHPDLPCMSLSGSGPAVDLQKRVAELKRRQTAPSEF